MRKAIENPRAREVLLKCARRLMLQKGFSATSIEDICRAAKLTKGCFFHYFENKDHLGRVLLEKFCCDTLGRMDSGCCHLENEPDPLKRVYGYVDFFIETRRKKVGLDGCLIGKFTEELSETNLEIRSICAQAFKQWAAVIEKDLKAAKAKYIPKSSLDVKSLAEHFVVVVQGAQILAKAKADPGVIAKNLKHFKEYLHKIFES